MSASRPNILFDANSLTVRRTGVGYYTARLVETLAAQHPDIMFTGYYYNFLGRKPKPHAPAAPNISYRSIYHCPGPVVNLLRRLRIEVPIELLTLSKPDFVLYTNFLNQPSLTHVPSTQVIHDLTFVDLPDYVARKNLHDLRTFIPRHIKRSNFLTTVSEFAKRRIQQEFDVPANKILVTPVPAESPKKQSASETKKLLHSLGITGDYILTLSTVEPRKNVLSMLDAFESLPKKLQQRYTLVITGGIGWNCETEEARLRQVREAGANIIHLGYVTEPQRAALYQEATIYTSASHYEGFGMTILEAMSYGIPCAISDIEVFREVSGDTALYFDQNNPASIARAWQRLLQDPDLQKQLGKVGRKRAESYKWSTVASNLYERITKAVHG